MENKLEMRKLSGQETFLLLKIISKVNAKEALNNFFSQKVNYSQRKDPREIGILVMADIIDVFCSNLDNAKYEINELIADLCGVDVKEIEELGFMEYNKLIMDFINKEELKDFFSLISSYLK